MKQAKRYNPDFVIVTSQLQRELHGIAANDAIPVINRVIDRPDSNGLDIRIHSLKWNRSVRLAVGEYELIN